MTRFGKVLRRSSLDELPQLWNVLRGEMSLVGPRPPIPYEVEHYPPHWFARFAVKPGITGLWQVNGRSEVPLEEMVRLDVEYARRRSLRLNLWILIAHCARGAERPRRMVRCAPAAAERTSRTARALDRTMRTARALDLTRAPRLLALLLAPALLALLPAAATATEEGNCASAPNPVVCENALPGDPPSDWQVQGVGDPTIQGFATSMSVNVGQTVSFKIKTPSTSYHIDILRLGLLRRRRRAHDRRRASSRRRTLPQTQPACLTDSSTGLIDCGNWGVSASWTVPSNAVSGVYIAHLVRDDTGGDSQIPFVVRNDASHSDILVQTSDATWEAYNDYGGNSLYTCTVACPPGNPRLQGGLRGLLQPAVRRRARDRQRRLLPLLRRIPDDLLARGERLRRQLHERGRVDSSGALLKNHKIFMSSGHDEYWSAGQRANVRSGA